MIDDLHSDTTRFGFGEEAGGVAIQCGLGFFVDLGFEGGLEGAVGVVCTEEVGVADEETFFVVVGVDEPASDTLWTVTTHFAGLRMEYVNTVDSDLCPVVGGQ
jgi:hypothetical protein